MKHVLFPQALVPTRGIATAANNDDVFENAKVVAFDRSVNEAQPDEKVRYDAIYDAEIAPYYTAQTVDNALLSAQFLDEGEPVSKDNRELMVKLSGDYGFNVEMADQHGTYLGLVGGFTESKVMISPQTLGGKKILIVTFPEYGEADLYGFDPNQGENGRYVYGTTVVIPS